ncbi:MAG: transposase [Candidatus Omnitrophica bacterium]|nr:transposase [Candidatus Omnitrophota bacterium]
MENDCKHSKEFKLEAIKLLREGIKPAAEIARELGIKRELLYRWRAQVEEKGSGTFKNGPGRPRKEDESEVTRLRRELEAVKEERDILKKAAAYFARDLK